MFAYNGFLDDDDATKEAGTDFARRGDSAPRNSDDDVDVADFFEREPLTGLGAWSRRNG